MEFFTFPITAERAADHIRSALLPARSVRQQRGDNPQKKQAASAFDQANPRARIDNLQPTRTRFLPG